MRRGGLGFSTGEIRRTPSDFARCYRALLRARGSWRGRASSCGLGTSVRRNLRDVGGRRVLRQTRVRARRVRRSHLQRLGLLFFLPRRGDRGGHDVGLRREEAGYRAHASRISRVALGRCHGDVELCRADTRPDTSGASQSARRSIRDKAYFKTQLCFERRFGQRRQGLIDRQNSIFVSEKS